MELGGHRESQMCIDMLDFAQREKNKQAKTFLDPKPDGFSAQAHLLLR